MHTCRRSKPLSSGTASRSKILLRESSAFLCAGFFCLSRTAASRCRSRSSQTKRSLLLRMIPRMGSFTSLFSKNIWDKKGRYSFRMAVCSAMLEVEIAMGFALRECFRHRMQAAR